MPLIKLRYQNWKSSSYAYAPPLEDILINTDEIVHVSHLDPSETRGSGPFCRVKLQNGDTFTVQATVAEIDAAVAKACS